MVLCWTGTEISAVIQDTTAKTQIYERIHGTGWPQKAEEKRTFDGFGCSLVRVSPSVRRTTAAALPQKTKISNCAL